MLCEGLLYKVLSLLKLPQFYTITYLAGVCTLRVQINVRVQIIVRGGSFWKINKHTDPIKRTGYTDFYV